MWRYWSISTATWGDKIEMPAFEFTGARRLNGGSQGTAVFKMGDPGVAEVVTKASLMPWERILVAEWNDNAVYAGFITAVSEDQDKKTVTVTHKDIWALWKRRHVLTVRGDGDQSAPPITWHNRTLATHANLVVNRGMFGEPAARYSLPLIMTADVVGTEDREYFGYHFLPVERALMDLIETEGGPDVDFDVQNVQASTFRWVMRSGELTQGFWEWDATAIKKEVSGLKLDTDADDLTNRMIGAGEGTERNMPVRRADSFTGSGPALETVEKYDIADGAQLQRRVNADIAATDEYTQQISFDIPVTGDVSVGDLILGGTARVRTSGLLFLDEGHHDYRLIGYEFDKKHITLQLQEIGG